MLLRIICYLENSFSDVSDIATNPPTPPAPHAARTAQKGIIIKEPAPEEPTPKEVPKGKGKKKAKGSFYYSFQRLHSLTC